MNKLQERVELVSLYYQNQNGTRAAARIFNRNHTEHSVRHKYVMQRRQLRCMKSGGTSKNIKLCRFQQHMSFLEASMSTESREENVKDSDDDSEPPSTLPISDDFEEVPEGNLDEGEGPQQSNTAD
ncbi:unnamed protein product [Psylliodes chrysocephalus]|uniref:Uncharacterized protein n=1 Tax=Psylliodes chrysocephalus TaxID=3402493 RepID=A0A9P0D8S2_9CUCU|nr:unnamed protein product [Psylliodes chrysocephala]